MPYSGVYVFGDSLVDAGNALKLAEFADDIPFKALPEGAPTADQGYHMGRFTNGFNFADLISNKFISIETKPVFPFGYKEELFGLSLPFVGDPKGNNLNFAYGGAQIRKGDEAVPDLDDQTDAYRDAVDGDADSNALYLIEIGSNDVRELVPATGAITDMSIGLTRLTDAAEELNEEIGQLIAIGVRHIVVTGIPDLGIIPRYNDAAEETVRRTAATDYSRILDEKIQSQVNQLNAANPTADIQYVSLADATSTIVANLDKIYGAAALYPLNESELVFLDSVHPTVQVHALLTAFILDSIGETSADETIASTDPDYALGGNISAAGETDPIVISLAADTSYRFEMLGVSSGAGALADPLLRISAPGGLQIATDDDAGLGLDATLEIKSTDAGDHVITLSAVGTLTGSYQFQASGDAAGDTSYHVSTTSALILESPGEGSDTVLASVSYALAAGVSIETLATSSETAIGNINLTGNELNQRIVGNAGANNLDGKSGNDALAGLAGDDVLHGDIGDDTLEGGAGANSLYGSDGNDLLEGRTVGASGLDADYGFGGAGADTINGSESNDHLYGGGSTVTPGDGADSISGLAGGDYIQGNAGADTLDGGTGTDRIQGGADGDAITGGAGSDSINGNRGDDTLEGGSDDDSLRGGQGDDLINGGDGDDLLAGDREVDTLTGGLGADIFIFTGQGSALSTGADLITDYVDNTDHISIGYSPAVLIGSAQTSLSVAATVAQQQFDAHPGDAEVAAISVGADTYLFYSSDAGATPDSAVLVVGMGSDVFTLDDFV